MSKELPTIEGYWHPRYEDWADAYRRTDGCPPLSWVQIDSHPIEDGMFHVTVRTDNSVPTTLSPMTGPLPFVTAAHVAVEIGKALTLARKAGRAMEAGFTFGEVVRIERV